MKKLIILLFVVFSSLVITTAGISKNISGNKIINTLYDTLPGVDTANFIDTFGGIKNMNDTNLKAKKDSLFK